MSLFSRKDDDFSRKNDEQVEQVRREFASEMQALQQLVQQNTQTMQQGLQLLQQSLTEEVQQLAQKRVSYWTSAQGIIEHLQRQVNELSGRIARFAPDPLSSKKENLGNLHDLDIQKAQIVIKALDDYGSSHRKIEDSFDTARQEREKEWQDLKYSAASLFSPVEPNTGPIQKLLPEPEKEVKEEHNPPEAV